jgi:hypothetical protein
MTAKLVVVDLAERRAGNEEARLAALGERIAALESIMMIHAPKHGLSLIEPAVEQ